MISSRQPIVSLNGTIFFWISSWAFPSQTSVPWERPAIFISSPKVVGLVSSTNFIVNEVPNSGIPSVPVLHIICSLVTPKASVLVNILMVSLSSIGTFIISVPDCIWIIRNCVGSEWPKISSFKTHWSMAW